MLAPVLVQPAFAAGQAAFFAVGGFVQIQRAAAFADVDIAAGGQGGAAVLAVDLALADAEVFTGGYGDVAKRFDAAACFGALVNVAVVFVTETAVAFVTFGADGAECDAALAGNDLGMAVAGAVGQAGAVQFDVVPCFEAEQALAVFCAADIQSGHTVNSGAAVVRVAALGGAAL